MKAKLSIIAATLSVLLTACGGGGGGATTGSTPNTPSAPSTPTDTTPTPPVVVPGDLQTTVPAPTYQAASQEMAFFTALNNFRSAVGLGLLAQNQQLDQAAKNHVNYLLSNPDINFSAIDQATGRPMFHVEQQTRSGFTGVLESDRAKAVGYMGAYVGESGAYGLGNGGAKVLADLASGIYHRQGLMFQEQREIGISMGSDSAQTTVIELGYMTAPQRNASNFVGAYPADKQTDVPLASYQEVPNPYPELTTFDAVQKGTSYPISIVTKSNTTLTVATFTVTEQGQTEALPMRLFTKDSDPNKFLLGNIAFVVGRAPFKANTNYTVRFVGTVDGAAISKTWTFTTASK
ncbi:hypothetical protein GCM10027277_57480 [Pseudoduganella ginsengisoli]|nr:CAP domain-containing protein [Pseudoduganella ginsengisoli]